MKFPSLPLIVFCASFAFGHPGGVTTEWGKPQVTVFGAGRVYDPGHDVVRWVAWSGDVTRGQANCSNLAILGLAKESTLCDNERFEFEGVGFKFQNCASDGKKLPGALIGDGDMGHSCGAVIAGPPLQCRGKRAITLTLGNRWTWTIRNGLLVIGG
ncbi:hypothetical protein GQ53DRAFT_759082 [Thozetella sp. PMI_491]|nr:hypothetical protein GQ53DRAFT_759082 [Thozetella sp. PMI_491]